MTPVGPDAIHELLRSGDHERLIRFIDGLPPAAAADPRVQLAFGLALLRAGRGERAFDAACRLTDRAPLLPDAHLLKASALRELGRAQHAVETLRTGLAVKPDHGGLLRMFAECDGDARTSPRRVMLFARAHAAAPGDPRVCRAYAQVLAQASGEARFGLAPEAALAVANKAIAIDPGCGEARSARLFARQCLDDTPTDTMLQDAIDAAAAHAAGVATPPPPPHRLGSPLRVGFLACGLAGSSVRHFLAGLFAHHDPDAVAMTLYDHPPAGSDPDYEKLTRRIQVVDAAGWSNDALAGRIADDRVDVLVDLIGHGWYGRRMGVLARRPAPVQIAYCGYLGTLGLPTVDWFLSDQAIHPAGSRERYVERLLPLPHWVCYRPPDWAPPVTRRPDGGPVVFGSFNQIGKVSPACLAFWRSVLDAVPGSRLLVKRHDLGGHEGRFRDRLQAHGLPLDRVDLDGRPDPHRDHLAAYGRVDIALDTFPYSGATTACEALWMGVPVVALSGEPAVSRMSRCILRAAGLEHWAGDGVTAAVAIAGRLAADDALRRRFRSEARTHLSNSPLCDAASFSRSFETACRTAAMALSSAASGVISRDAAPE